MPESAKPSSCLKVWLLAGRPWSYTASGTSVVLGLGVACYLGHPLRPGLFALTLLGIVCFHTGANLLNDCYDYQSGLDRQVLPMSGAVVRGWLTPRQAFRGALAVLAVGIGCGLFLTWAAGWVVLLLGVLGTLLAFGYTRRGFCLKYVGLGDLTIFLAFGVLPVFGSYWVQARAFDWRPFLWSLPLVSNTVAILHANNWHDLNTDTAGGTRTVASMLGERGSAVYYHVLTLGPFVLVCVYALLGLAPGVPTLGPWAALVALLAVPKAVGLARINRESNPEAFAMLDGKTAQLQLLFGVLLSAGFFAARYIPGVQ